MEAIEIDEMAELAVWLCVCLAMTSILTEVVVADDVGVTSLDNTEILLRTEHKHFPNQVTAHTAESASHRATCAD